VPDPENTALLRCAVALYRKFKQFPQAMRFAMQLNDQTLIQDIFLSCKDL
jgi:26S proteasome regulatory subunit N1